MITKNMSNYYDFNSKLFSVCSFYIKSQSDTPKITNTIDSKQFLDSHCILKKNII